MATGRSRGLVLLGLLTLTAGLYLPLRAAPFVYEDFHWQGGLPTPQGWQLPSRALSMASFDLTRTAPAAHLANVGLHLANGALVYGVAAALIPGAAAVWAAGVWLLHPLNSAAVSYVSARTDLLMTCGVLLAVWGSLRASWWGWGVTALGALMAALSKEIGLVAFPLVWMTQVVWRPQTWLARWGWVGIALGAGLVARTTLSHFLTNTPELGGSPLFWPQFLVLQLSALWHLLALVPPSPEWRSGFSIDHDVLAIGAAGQVTAVMLTGLVLAVAAALWRVSAMTVWVVGWVSVALLPRFVVRSSEFVTEPQMYLSMVGISLGLGVLAARLWAWRSSPQKAMVYGKAA